MKKLIINEEEKSRILSLHTNAIKNYLNEQDASASPQPLVIQLAGTFESGQADIKNMAPIEDAKKQVSNFLSKLPQNQRIGITIKAGESQVPNQAPYEEPGSLATARANELKAKLTSVFSGFGDKVVVNPNIETKVGETKWDKNLGKDNEVYRKEQYANAVVQAIGGVPAKPTTKPEPTCEKYQFYFGNRVLTTYNKGEAVKFLNKLAGKDQSPTLKPNCMNFVGTAYATKTPSLPNDYSTHFKEAIGWTNGEKVWKSEDEYRSNPNTFWFDIAQNFPGLKNL